MANLLQSTQTTATTAPSFYTDYLSNLASQGQAAQQAAQYVGAQPLQQQAFTQAGQSAGAFQPLVQQGANIIESAAGTNPLSIAQPYLTSSAVSGGLSQANPYLAAAALGSPAELAQQYMNPYIQSAVQQMSDIAQRNIQQNLAPAATAAAVGSGQFGSQRGAQVLGQVERQAEQDLNSQIAQMLASGYGQALQAGTSQQQLLGQLGQTAGTLGQQQASLLGQLGSTAGTLGTQQMQQQIAAGQALGGLGQVGQQLSLADINALSTLGGQQQQIAQNQQLFPLTTLSQLANIMQGAQVPTTVSTQLQMSPFSALGAAGSGLLGLIQPQTGLIQTGTDASGKPIYGVGQIPGSAPYQQIGNLISGLFSGNQNNVNPNNASGLGIPQGAVANSDQTFTYTDPLTGNQVIYNASGNILSGGSFAEQ
jgi:hypothetical protein